MRGSLVDETDDTSLTLGDPDVHRAIREGVSNRLLLVLTSVAVQPDEDLVPQDVLHGSEDWSPCAKRQFDDGVLIVGSILPSLGPHEVGALHSRR